MILHGKISRKCAMKFFDMKLCFQITFSIIYKAINSSCVNIYFMCILDYPI